MSFRTDASDNRQFFVLSLFTLIPGYFFSLFVTKEGWRLTLESLPVFFETVLSKSVYLVILFTLALLVFVNQETLKSKIKITFMYYTLIIVGFFFTFFLTVDVGILLEPSKIGIYRKFLTLSGAILFVFFWSAKSNFFLESRMKRYIAYYLPVVIISLYLSSYLLIDLNHPYLSNATDLMSVIHSIVQARFGSFANFNLFSFYGAYGTLLVPIFHIFPMNVFSISVVFAVLMFISLLGLAHIVFNLVPNVPRALITFLSTLFLQFYCFTIWPAEKYFQVYPIRMFFPTLAVVALILLSKRQYFLQVPAFSICAVLAIIWNPETGYAVWFSFFLFLLYWGFHLGMQIRFLALYLTWTLIAFATYLGLLTLISGRAFSIHLYFLAGSRWWNNLEEYRWNKFWVLVYLVYAFGLFRTVKLKKGACKAQDYQLIAVFLSLLGLSLLPYHFYNYIQHDATLSNIVWPAPILLGYLLHQQNRSPHGVKRESNNWKPFPINFKQFQLEYPAALVLFCFLAASAVTTQFYGIQTKEMRVWDLYDRSSVREIYRTFNTDKGIFYATNIDQLDGLESPWSIRYRFAEEAAQHNNMGHNLVILSFYDSLMYLGANARSPMSWANWYHANLVEDFVELEKAFSNKGIRYVITDSYPGNLQAPWGNYGGRDKDILAYIQNNFQKIHEKDAGYFLSLIHI